MVLSRPLTFEGGGWVVCSSLKTTLRYMVVVNVLIVMVTLLSMAVIVWGLCFFDEYEIGVEFLPKDYNSFELGVSNRNYKLDDGGLEQELRIGVLLFSFIFLFRRFDA